MTCKIRLLKTTEDTLKLCRMIEECGVAAIAIHGRTKEERPNHPNHNDIIKTVAEGLTVPVIANGGSKEITCYEDFERFRKDTGTASVMLARAAMWNCSILRPEGPLPLDIVLESYLKYCVDYDNPFTYSKYTVQNMLRELQDTPRGKAFLESQTLQEICAIWGLKEYFETKVIEQDKLRKLMNVERESGKTYMPPSADYITIAEKSEDGQRSYEMPVQFIRGNFNNADLPKMLLNTHIFRKQLTGPKYSCIEQDKFFCATVIVDGIKYSSSLKEKSRRYSEQAAAMVCLHVLKIVDKTYGFIPAAGARKYQHVINDANSNGKRGEKRDSVNENNSPPSEENDADNKRQKVKLKGINNEPLQEKIIESSGAVMVETEGVNS